MFREFYRSLSLYMIDAPVVETESWQGVKANLATRELPFISRSFDLEGREDLNHWRADIEPNLPWADDHFAERVSGEPLNPGEQWRNWPYAHGAARHVAGGRFNHTYAERLWPKFARRTGDGRLPEGTTHAARRYPAKGEDLRPRYGIAGYYGDLDDLVNLLVAEPHTRQAWIPLFFPEDTGTGDRGRKPCTLGYQFLLRDGQMHMYYPLRSCDLVRHLRDDWYLAVRLLLWVLDQCRLRGSSGGYHSVGYRWRDVRPGTFFFHATSLHVFETDVPALRARLDEGATT